MLQTIEPGDKAGFLAALRGDGQPREAVSLADHLAEVDPGKHLDQWHTGKMAAAGQALLDGEIENLLVCAPSRVGKSRTLMQGMPSCRMRNEPRSKAMITCASADLVGYHSGYARQFAEAAGAELRQDSKNKSLWLTTRGGAFRAVVYGGGPLGFGWDLLGIDDPFASEEDVRSLLKRRAAWRRFQDFHRRKQGRPEGGSGGRLLVSTRLARGDVVGQLLDALEDGLQERWHALILRAHQEAQPYALPSVVVAIEDERKPGAPLCDDTDLMAVIEERRVNDTRAYQTVDQQNPPKDAGGGIFRESWLPIVGSGREDLARPLEALRAMAEAGELAAIRRMIRGHDPSGGGAGGDAVASAAVAWHADGTVTLWDPTQSHPPEAGVKAEALANAQRQPASEGVGQAVPKEGGTGKTFTTDLSRDLRAQGYTVHLMPTGKGKIPLALPLAAKASWSCRGCSRVVVTEDERHGMPASDLCACEEPDVQRGKVRILATPRPAMPGEKSAAELFRQRLHDFDGEGDDHQVDAVVAAFNAGAGPGSSGGGAFDPGW